MNSGHFSAQPLESKPRCPHCGAERVSARPQRCWLCHEELGQSPQAPEQDEHIQALTERIALRRPESDPGPMAAFGILAVILGLGLAFTAPGVLVLLLIVVTPALIRTSVIQNREGSGGAGAVWTFLSSVGTVIVVGIASFAAFFVTCFVVCLGGLGIEGLRDGRHDYNWIFVASVGAGLIPGLAVAILLFRRFWARKA